MEEAELRGPGRPGAPGRLLVKAVVLGIAAALAAAAIAASPRAAAGALAGGLAAGLYAWSYLRTHLGRTERTRVFDPEVAREATVRLLMMVTTGAGMWLAGRTVFLAFVATFAVTFAVLIASEIPRAVRQLKASGTESPGRPS